MQPENGTKQEAETESPNANVDALGPPNSTNGVAATAAVAPVPQPNGKSTNGAPNGAANNGQFPPPKTDKPRPHVCGTCGRSFARLEHLKRHERSHTKEKPFECPECTRCFARRDLLLRHQQKLHMTNTTARGPRSARRESVGGTAVGGAAKVRKNSVANANVGGLASNNTRPRANTISHIDLSSLGIFDGAHPTLSRVNSAGLDTSHLAHGGIQAPMGFDYRGVPNHIGHHGNMLGLPKLETNINNADIANSLRTAPPQANFGEFDLDQLFTPHTTINPAALHFGSAGGMSSSSTSNMPMGPFDMAANPQVSLDDDFGWMRNWNMQLQTGFDNEQAIEESSPSRMSSGDSPGDYNESLANSNMGMPIQNGVPWPPQDASQQNLGSTAFQIDALGSGLANLDASNGTLSPSHMHDPTPTADTYFHQAMMQHNGHQQQQQQSQPQPALPPQPQQQPQQPPPPPSLQQQTEIMPGPNSQYVGQALSNFGSNSPSISSSSMNGSARQSSVTSMSTESITDSTRQALLASLSQPSVFSAQNARKFSQPTVSSPLSPGNARMAVSNQGPTLPSTADIKRYVAAFVQYAHPHLPVVHIPTLSFETIEPSGSPPGSSPHGAYDPAAGSGGARCLILGMSAIGALYEYDHPASKELFEAAKKMISLYLEERRRADMSAAVNGGATSGETPLWLVQAMLLTVVYGHHCGDRTSADIASNHIAALVSLARAANLARAPTANNSVGINGSRSIDVEMGESAASTSPLRGADLHAHWHSWKVGEERKRVLYAIFILSSLLTTAYNQAPTIMNSEIMLDLPCAEELFVAETAEEWHNRGGLATAEQSSVSFAVALSTLLTASQRQSTSMSQNHYGAVGKMSPGDGVADNDLKPSTFGCLVLINALHNYIWETRNRHHGKEWTAQETEAMFAHIEPALNAWQVAWKSHDHHKLERPNPFGLGPLSADSIPLLDLAFVRLFVNLGRTAEAFWRRDFDGMAEALAAGSDPHVIAASTENGETHDSTLSSSIDPSSQANGASALQQGSLARNSEQSKTRRERYFRKAAFYAADSLTIACNFNLTYTDPIAPELPIQSAICFFDCAQVLGEWVTTVQERVGRFIGVIGRDPVDYTQVPAIMLLETEDVELLQKMERICNNLEAKRLQHESLLAMDMNQFNPNSSVSLVRNGVDLNACGLGSKILRCVAMMLEKAVIWPITHVMAKGLEVEAIHMDRRTEAACQQ